MAVGIRWCESVFSASVHDSFVPRCYQPQPREEHEKRHNQIWKKFDDFLDRSFHRALPPCFCGVFSLLGVLVHRARPSRGVVGRTLEAPRAMLIDHGHRAPKMSGRSDTRGCPPVLAAFFEDDTGCWSRPLRRHAQKKTGFAWVHSWLFCAAKNLGIVLMRVSPG